MNLPKLEIIEGDAVKVQLTSETHAPARGGVKANDKLLVSSKVLNRMRLFIMRADGKEQDFQFVNSTVGVREGNRVAVVRAKPNGPGPWLVVALYNLTTQTREEQIGAFAKAARQQWIGARWRAGMWAAGAFALDLLIGKWLHPHDHSFWIAISFGIVAYPIAWAIGWITDLIVLPERQREAEKALRFAIDEKMSHAKKDRDATTKDSAKVPPLPDQTVT